MSGADLTWVVNRNRSGILKMLVAAEQLDELIGSRIGCTSGRNNISKDLKQGLLKLRKTVALAKKEYNLDARKRLLLRC